VFNTALPGRHENYEIQRKAAEKHGYYRGIDSVDHNMVSDYHTIDRKVVGLCHGHLGYKAVARVIGLDPKDVTFQAIGFNHRIWMTDFRYKGEDVYPMIDDWIDRSRLGLCWSTKA